MSNAKYWCDLCKCWLADTVTARANHERGTGHKLNMQRKLREMRKAAADEKKEKAETVKALKKIEAEADKAFKNDQDKLVRSQQLLSHKLPWCNSLHRHQYTSHRGQMHPHCLHQLSHHHS